MSRRYRRKRNGALKYFFIIILLFLIGILCYKIYMDQYNPKTKKENKSNPIEKIDKKVKETKEEKKTNDKKESNTKNDTTNTNSVTNKSSSDEKKENKNEQARRGGSVNMELLGEENVTVSVGDKYKDAGVKATYSDGSDASVEVDIDNAVNTSKAGTYTVTYSVGNTVIIRRVTVE